MITGVVTAEDYVEAQLIHRRPLAVAVNMTLGAIGVLGVVLLIAGQRQWGLMLFIGAICGFIGESAQARIYIPGKARKHYSQFKGIEAPITYAWDGERFWGKSVRGNIERSWGDVLKVRESESHIVLYTTDVLFEVVPKRWFSNSDQMNEFKSLASKHVADRSVR